MAALDGLRILDMTQYGIAELGRFDFHDIGAQ